MLIDIIIIIVLLLLSAFCSASETAFTSLSLLQVENLASSKGKQGKRIKAMYEKPDIFIATVLICNNLVNISLSAYVTSYTIRTWGNEAIGIVTGVLTLLILIFGEVTPKNMAIAWNETIALYTAPVFAACSIILYPVIVVINSCSSFMTRIIGNRNSKKMSAEMIYSLISYAANKGLVKDYEKRMVQGVFNLGHSTLRNIMTHRTDVFSLKQDCSVSEVIETVDKLRFSRIPIFDENPEDIVGIVKTSRIMKELWNDRYDTKLKDIAEEALFVPESRKISQVFKQMKKEKEHIAVVLDEYGGLAGIVTLDDIVAGILGEISDESEEPETEKVIKISAREFIIYGEAPVASIDEKLKISLPWDNSIRTIGGLLIKYIERIPAAGEEVYIEKFRFIIEDVSDRQILKVRLFLPDPE